VSSEQESNPEIEVLQEELNQFRQAGFRLAGNDIEVNLKELIGKTPNTKSTAVIFVGIPGSGKSKLLEKISRHFKVQSCHVRDLAVKNPKIRKIEKEFYRLGEIIPGIEKDFLNFAFEKKSPYYLLDGFPRTLFQAVELYRYCADKKIGVKIIEIRLQDGREVFQSYYRQSQRATYRVKKGVLFGQAQEEENQRIVAKIRVALELDLYVIETLRALGAIIITLDASKGPSKMFTEFKEKLGLSIASTD